VCERCADISQSFHVCDKRAAFTAKKKSPWPSLEYQAADNSTLASANKIAIDLDRIESTGSELQVRSAAATLSGKNFLRHPGRATRKYLSATDLNLH